MLAATLADRLLIARGSALSTGRVDCSPRCVALLQPLLAGWATLSAQGFLPGMHSINETINQLQPSFCLQASSRESTDANWEINLQQALNEASWLLHDRSKIVLDHVTKLVD